MVQRTSLEAFDKVGRWLSERRKQVAETLAIYGPMSNAEISRRAGIPLESVTGRTLELREMGAVVLSGFALNEKGNRVHVWRLRGDDS